MIKSFIPLPLCLFTFLNFSSPQAQAQDGGKGAFGANRRVTVLGGYGKIKTKFVEPESFIINHAPASVPSGYWDGYAPYNTDPNHYTEADKKAHRSRPDIYVGSRYETTTIKNEPAGAGEVDAGVAWVERMSSQSQGPSYTQGWKVYVRIDGGDEREVKERDENGQIRPSNRNMRIPKNELGTFTLESALGYENNQSCVTFNITNNNSYTQGTTPKWYASTATFPIEIPKTSTTHKFPADSGEKMSVKRVVAITQNYLTYGLPQIVPIPSRTDLQPLPNSGGGEINSLGTQILSCQVAKISVDKDGKLLYESDGNIKYESYVNMSTAVRKYQAFLPKVKNAPIGVTSSPYVIDLRHPYKRPDDENASPPQSPNFYDSETIDIRLISKPADVKGTETKKGKN